MFQSLLFWMVLNKSWGKSCWSAWLTSFNPYYSGWCSTSQISISSTFRMPPGFNPYYSGWCSTRHGFLSIAGRLKRVSILIILDGAQQGLWRLMQHSTMLGFNPYYSGWCSTSGQNATGGGMSDSLFQSLLFWMVLNKSLILQSKIIWKLVSILIILDGAQQALIQRGYGQTVFSFNPYYSGWCSTSRPRQSEY